MDPSNIVQLVIIVICLGLSAFFSSAETAFMSVNRIRLRSLIDEGNKRAVIVTYILDNSSKMLSAILIGNNIVNISVSAIVTTFTIDVFGSYATGIATGLLTLLVLLFGEITPKTAATIKAEPLALFYAPIIKFLMTVLTPVIIVVDFLAKIVLKLLRINKNDANTQITEEELRTFVKVSHEAGVIESDEKQIINNLFDFGDSKAKDVMIPKIDMTVADVDSTYQQIIALFRDTQYTRIPIYQDNPDNVIGILNIKDLILAPVEKAFSIKNVIREPFFTYEQKNTSDLFKEMQQSSHSIAIVLDEYGATTGMITTEDLLEEIVGDIRDEYDADEGNAFIKLSNNTYRTDASYKLDDINEAIGVALHSEDNDSIGGYIIEKLDRIPAKGERFTIDNIEFMIERASSTRIETIIFRIQNQ